MTYGKISIQASVEMKSSPLLCRVIFASGRRRSFPPKSRQNPSDKPLCYFYQLDYPGEEWKIAPHLLWKAQLVNPLMPMEAVVSMRGYLVTLNDYGEVGYNNAVSIYDPRGRLIRTYALDELLPAQERNEVVHSTSSRWWNLKAKYYFTEHPGRFYVVLQSGKALEFNLANGNFIFGAAARFIELDKLQKKPSAGEYTEIWQTSLRFSSITDVLQAQKPR